MPVVIDSPSPNESVGVCAWHNCVQVVDTYVVVALPIISSILYIILIVQLGIHMIIHLQLLLSQDDRALPVEIAFFIQNSFPSPCGGASLLVHSKRGDNSCNTKREKSYS